MTQLYQQEQHTMRITIEPTHQGLDRLNPNPKAILEIPSDDYTIDEVLESLVIPALRAFGYIIEDGQIYFDSDSEDQSAVGAEFLRRGYDQLAKEAEDLREERDQWAEEAEALREERDTYWWLLTGKVTGTLTTKKD